MTSWNLLVEEARNLFEEAWITIYCGLDDLYLKIRKYAKEKPKEFTLNVFLILLVPIVAAAVFGVQQARELTNAVFRLLLVLTAMRTLCDRKRLRDILVCIALMLFIAVMLQYLGLTGPNWLTVIWHWLKDPDYVGGCEKLVEWVCGPFWHDPKDATFWNPRTWMPR